MFTNMNVYFDALMLAQYANVFQIVFFVCHRSCKSFSILYSVAIYNLEFSYLFVKRRFAETCSGGVRNGFPSPPTSEEDVHFKPSDVPHSNVLFANIQVS